MQRGLERLSIQAESCINTRCDAPLGPDARRQSLAAMVAREPQAAWSIAEGALLRLAAEARCFDRYRRELIPRAVSTRPEYLCAG